MFYTGDCEKRRTAIGCSYQHTSCCRSTNVAKAKEKEKGKEKEKVTERKEKVKVTERKEKDMGREKEKAKEKVMANMPSNLAERAEAVQRAQQSIRTVNQLVVGRPQAIQMLVFAGL